MSEIKVTGRVNGSDLEFDARAPDQYEAETGRSDDGAYRAEIVAMDAFGNVSVAHETAYTNDAWIEPVWWRTQADADRAQALNDRIAADGLTGLTPEEQTEWLSGLLGCLNYYDLNRIEADTRWLSRMLYTYGYGLAGLEHKADWAMADVPLAGQLERVRSNLQHLIDIYHAQAAQLPESLEKPGWQEINDVERLLYEMKDMIDRMVRSFLYCGMPACGQEVVL